MMQPARPLLGVALAYMAGLVITKMFQAPFFAGALLWGIGVVSGFLMTRWRQGFLLPGAVGLGVMFMVNALTLPLDHLSRGVSWVRGEQVVAEGKIVSGISTDQVFGADRHSFVIEVKAVYCQQMTRRVCGKMMVIAFGNRGFDEGDEIRVKGTMRKPFDFRPGRASYQEYLKRHGVEVMMTLKKSSPPEIVRRCHDFSLARHMRRWRSLASEVFRAYLSQDEAALMDALVLGDQRRVPARIRELFARTGTAHILAVSGFNVGIAAFGFFLLFKMLPLPRRCRLAFTMMAVVFYAFLTGAASPVTRAAVMSSLFLLSFIVEREVEVFNSLALAALGILILDPQQMFDIGFQLSFSCVAAILLWTPLWGGADPKRKHQPLPRVMRFLIESIGVSLSALIGSAALVAYYFGYVAPVMLLTNVPLVPLIALITALGGGLIVCGWCVPVAVLVAACIKVCLNLAVLLVYGCSRIPGGWYQTDTISAGTVVAFYGIAGLLLILLYWRIKKTNPLSVFWSLGI